MIIAYSTKSEPSARLLAEQDEDIELIKASNPQSDINWGRSKANSKLNPDISNSTNKRVMRELFKEHDVPMPKLLAVNGNIEFNNIITLPCVGRPDQHSKGRGFWLCNSWADVAKAQNGTSRKAAATHFMEFVDAPLEYRVHIFMGKSIRMSVKEFTGEERYNHRDYTTRKPEGKKKYIRNAAKSAVQALGLDFGAVDILVNPETEQCWVLEVNAAPGLGGSMPKLYSDVFKEWYQNA